MEHFSEQTWADFVRGVGASGTSLELEGHLAADCEECKASFALWGRLASLAAKEGDYAPPESLIRLVKLHFASKQKAEPQGWMIARLIFDSATQPLPMGVRSGAASTRQVVYEAEGLTVDLRFERKQHSNTIAASGQVLDKEAPRSWLGNAAAIVLWTDKGQMVTKTLANNHGEFHFEFELQDQLRISIITANYRTLRMALGNLE
jgi:anti-sigma factor RsiW